jgi:hypothetical protein
MFSKNLPNAHCWGDSQHCNLDEPQVAQFGAPVGLVPAAELRKCLARFAITFRYFKIQPHATSDELLLTPICVWLSQRPIL